MSFFSMLKKAFQIRFYYIVICLGILYLTFGEIYHFFIPCLFHEVTGLYCPGCGITRMIKALFHLRIYQAFRYNPLLFFLLPLFLSLFTEQFYSKIKNRTAIIEKIPSKVWYGLIVVLILYCILRNFIPYLKPTVVS